MGTTIAATKVWRVRQSVILALLTTTIAGCMGGDDPGYHVLVENRSTNDLIIVMEGVGIYNLPGTARKAFLAKANAPATAGPWVYVGFDTNGGLKPGRITLYASDCRAVADFEVPAGTYALSINEAGAAVIAPLETGDFAEGIPTLAFAPHDCP